MAVAALLLLLAVALRIADFGNPVIHVDEQYYLLVGERWVHGALPYVDVWDRKPVGLFALYAVFATLGDGIAAYQIGATIAAALTAYMVFRAAGVVGANRVGALAAAVAYLVWLSLLGGRGGQAPVFYNLPIAAAALLAIQLPTRTSIGGIVTSGVVACLFCGIAIQIKPTAAFEGAFVGLAHVWALHRRAGLAATAGAALLWLAAGLGPTAGVMLAYRAIGPSAFEAWWFANATSILLRPGYPMNEIAGRLLGIGAQLSPLILCAAIATRWRRGNAAAWIATAWLAAALVGFLAIGTFFDHYALPLIAPLCVAAAATLGRLSRALVATLGLGLLLFAVERGFVPDDRAGARAVARVVAANSGSECPYVFIGDTITYHLARTCLPTTRAFPNMLAYATEAGATGVDEVGEVRRILAARPPVIVVSTRGLAIWNRGSIDALKVALRADYRAVFSVPRANYRTVVYLRNDRRFKR